MSKRNPVCNWCGETARWHGPNGECHYEFPPSDGMTIFIKTLVIFILLGIIAVGLWWGYHTWYVDTHCTTVLGTQVCQQPPANSGQIP